MDTLAVSLSPHVVEAAMPLESVGIDVDGTVKPLAELSAFTRAWYVAHASGNAVVYADSADEAAFFYASERNVEQADVSPIERPFQCAESERDKPHGWPRKLRGKLKGSH